MGIFDNLLILLILKIKAINLKINQSTHIINHHSDFGNTMDSYFQDGVKLKGVLQSKGVLHIGGEFEGELTSTSHLVVGQGGTVKGNIKTYDITNMGKINGDVIADNKVILKEESTVVGDITTHQLIVEEGSNFEGQCKMVKGKPQVRPESAPIPQEKKKSRLMNL